MSSSFTLTDEIVDLLGADTYRALDRLQAVSMATVRVATAVDHVYTDVELGAMASNPRVAKVLVWESGELVGFGAVTDDLDAMVQFNGEFFRRRYPEEAKRRTLWYAIAGIVHPDHWKSGVLNVMGTRLAGHLRQRGAEVLLWDAVDVRYELMYAWVERVMSAAYGPGTSQSQIDSHRWMAARLPTVDPEIIVDLSGT